MLNEQNKHNKIKMTMTQTCIYNLRLNILFTYLILVVLTTPSLCMTKPCNDNFWWDEKLTQCTECSLCNDQMIVLRPCQSHKDTFCGTISDLGVNLNRRLASDRKLEQSSSIKDNYNAELDWQAALLGAVAIACLLFFIAATFIALYYARQWRRMERRFDRDVEELSARLMAKLNEVQHHDNGTILLEDVTVTKGGLNVNPIEVQFVYLEQLLVGKDSKTFGPGNIYIEETGSSGGKS